MKQLPFTAGNCPPIQESRAVARREEKVVFAGCFCCFQIQIRSAEKCRCASFLLISKSPIEAGGEIGYTISVLPLKGEITDYLRGGRLRKVVAAAFGSMIRGIESAADRDNSATGSESD